MRTRWTWLGGVPVEAIEVVTEGATSLEVNVLPAEQAQPGPDLPAPQPAPVVVDAPPADLTIDAVAATLPLETLPDAEAVEMPEEGGGAQTGAEAQTYSLSERIGMGTVRGGKMGLFAAVGEAAAYGLDNIANIGLPPGTGVAVGCVLYAVNKALVPTNGGIL